MRRIFVHVRYFEREITPLITALEYKGLREGSRLEKEHLQQSNEPCDRDIRIKSQLIQLCGTRLGMISLGRD